jgi:hypothetical protein
MALESLADGARAVAWGAGGYQLLALPFSSGGSEHEGDGSFVRFSFWHSSAAHSPSQGGAMPVLLGADRIVVWKGLITDVPSFNACVRVPVLLGGGGTDAAGPWRATTRRDEEWDHLQFPQRYLSQNAPILRCAVSQVWRRERAGPCVDDHRSPMQSGAFVAVAGSRGLMIAHRALSKWRCGQPHDCAAGAGPARSCAPCYLTTAQNVWKSPPRAVAAMCQPVLVQGPGALRALVARRDFERRWPSVCMCRFSAWRTWASSSHEAASSPWQTHRCGTRPGRALASPSSALRCVQGLEAGDSKCELLFFPVEPVDIAAIKLAIRLPTAAPPVAMVRLNIRAVRRAIA